MATQLGTLERIDLRDIWPSEAQDFTPWLAQEDNLNVLASTLGLELELEAQEQEVGPFSADILCRNTDDASWVLIENQLEKTDHIHLGQLMTYAAGLHTVTIIWVAAKFRDQHRAALDWLNDITDEKFRFFGLEVELWKIGESPAAPKFNVVSKPNDWSRSVNQAARRISDEPLTETKALQLEFWTTFREYLLNEQSPVRHQKPLPQHWAVFGIGRSGFHLSGLLNSRENRIGVELHINASDAKAFFGLLEEQKTDIEQALDCDLEWMGLPDRKACRIVFYWNNVDPLDKDEWPQHREWMKENLEKFNTVFRPIIRGLDASEWQPIVDEDEVSE